MSRVYDALKKAEREQGSAPLPPRDSGAPAQPAPKRQMERQPAFQTDNLRGPHQVVGIGHQTKATDEFHVLATQLESFAAEHHKRVFIVTSACPEEGKSFVAFNLSVSLARAGRRVLIVDADIRTPTLHRPFMLTPLRGLATYLMGEASLRSCVCETGTAGLDLVPAGGTAVPPSELFANPRMREFIAQAEADDTWTYVLIDSPPVLAASETQIMARLAGGLLVVVGANQTPRSAVARSLEMLRAAPLVGLVFNRFEPPYSRRVEYGRYGLYSDRHRDR